MESLAPLSRLVAPQSKQLRLRLEHNRKSHNLLPDAILLDIQMPGMTGGVFLRMQFDVSFLGHQASALFEKAHCFVTESRFISAL